MYLTFWAYISAQSTGAIDVWSVVNETLNLRNNSFLLIELSVFGRVVQLTKWLYYILNASTTKVNKQ